MTASCNTVITPLILNPANNLFLQYQPTICISAIISYNKIQPYLFGCLHEERTQPTPSKRHSPDLISKNEFLLILARTQKHNLHGAKGIVEEIFNKEVAQHVEKAYPTADEAAKHSSSTLGQHAGNAVGKFSKVDDFFKMAQHLEQGHGRELAIEGAGAHR